MLRPWCSHPVASRPSGFTLLEACLACGALAFGLLALARLQASLLGSAEAGRERAEALRLAQATLERQRHDAALGAVPGAASGAAAGARRSQSRAVEGLARPARLTLDIADHPSLPHQAVRVTVSWRDRGGREQSLRLDTLVATFPPSPVSAAPSAPSALPPLPGPR